MSEVMYEEIFDGLVEEFEKYVPNDEDYLEEYPELVEVIKDIQNLVPTTEAEYKEAIRVLYDFLNEWYPDSVDDEDKAIIDGVLEKAREILATV